MITRIEIDGYKSFKGFSLDLFPFVVIAGSNAVGKSNLFDALRHLSGLATKTLREAFETERGSLYDLFTIYPDGSSQNTIKYAVEMLLPASIRDEFSATAELKYRRLRYELHVAKDNEGRLSIVSERLTPIKRGDDTFLKSHEYRHVKDMLPTLTGGRKPFIDTQGQQITLSQDGNAGNKRAFSLSGAQRSVLSSITTIEFPHVYATQRMLGDVHFLQLNPAELRQPSKLAASPYLTAEGKNLAAMLARLRKNDEDVLKMISNDLAMIVPSVDGVCLEEDTSREEYVISVRHVDGYLVRSQLLSDGTLRILALVAIGYDPEFSGTIILEEPENGVYPGRIADVVALLRDTGSLGDTPLGLRQVVTNTHSTLVLRAADDHELVFATLKKIPDAVRGSYTATEMGYIDGDLLSSRGLVARAEAEKLLSEKRPVGAL
ncbi:MAG: AAA family ATPase [Trueperaceae bacterium]|nr:AAA family ATPase [Trueperaceae bacterium]